MSFQLPDNNLIKEADDYIRKHRLVELFENLATAVAYNQPDDLTSFLIERLKNYDAQGLNGGIFTKDEARNVFKLFDLKQEKKISRERCIKGLQTMASSTFQYEQSQLSEDIPLEVDENKFISLCEKFLGFVNTPL